MNAKNIRSIERTGGRMCYTKEDEIKTVFPNKLASFAAIFVVTMNIAYFVIVFYSISGIVLFASPFSFIFHRLRILFLVAITIHIYFQYAIYTISMVLDDGDAAAVVVVVFFSSPSPKMLYAWVLAHGATLTSFRTEII